MNNDDHGVLVDQDAGPLVRPYLATGGRTECSTHWDLMTLLQTTEQVKIRHLDPEPGAVLMLCRQPISIAEVAAHLRLPAMVIRVLVDDLIQENAVHVIPPYYQNANEASGDYQFPEKELLEAVLAGLKRKLDDTTPSP